MLKDHRVLSSTLYMANPSTANTVAPTLALSQKVELFRSAWLTCLLKRGMQRCKRCKEFKNKQTDFLYHITLFSLGFKINFCATGLKQLRYSYICIDGVRFNSCVHIVLYTCGE